MDATPQITEVVGDVQIAAVRVSIDVRFCISSPFGWQARCATAALSKRSKISLFDQLVGTGERSGRDVEAKCLSLTLACAT
jgi:hypothetical protein